MNYPVAPPQASNFAGPIDALFGTITALTIFFTTVVLACVIFFAIKYRAGSKASRKNIVHDSKQIEIAWTLPPTILGLAIFAWGAVIFHEKRMPPADATEIFVMGKRWMWHIQHPNGVRENNTLTVPIGKPIKLTMISQDVIHAVYIPAFRVQYMAVPGRYTSLWFTPTKEGKYPLFCNMYCGTQHSEMGGYVYVVSPQKYNEFLQNGGESYTKNPNLTSLASQGEALYKRLNCASCHGAKDTLQGPTLAGVHGSQRRLTNGSTATADDDYLRESILEPYNKIVQGYTNTMPEYKTQLTEEQVRNLIEYMKTLGVKSAATN
jgi:cytochrome c oxidase subunit II